MVKLWIVWQCEGQSSDLNEYVGVATSREEAEKIRKSALKILRRKGKMIDEPQLSWFDITEVKTNKVHETYKEGIESI